MNIEIPKLERSLLSSPAGANSITQLVEYSKSIPLNIIEQNRYSATIENNGRKYYLTSKPEVPEEYEYALLTNIIPREAAFADNRIKIKRWLKYPIAGHDSNGVLDSWRNDFFYKEEEPEVGIPGLREPQIAALHSIMGHLKVPLKIATVVMPTGTGKTETMLAALVANRCPKLLVTVPSDSLRDQVSNKFITLGLLKQFEVIGSKSLYPIVGIIRQKFESEAALKEFLEPCNVVVSTMSWLTIQDDKIQNIFATTFSQVFIDEAHHVKADTWNNFRKKFEHEKVVQFTATPFRNDGKRLEGTIISNFPLRRAQDQGYYKKIDFIPIREFDMDKADGKIAEIAVAKLRQDIAEGYNHILMARCSSKPRADQIYELYKGYTEFNPVKIYSSVKNQKDIYQQILEKKTRIIVCVDMLGEGFDLPELKIAAFHDIRRSLPITLQLAGRFTRTKQDEELGNASFIANIADLDVRAELSDLYATDADWNAILSDVSYQKVNEQIEFKDFMEGFNLLGNTDIPFQNIKPKLSTVIYKNKGGDWRPENFAKGIPGYDNLEFKFDDLNKEQKVLVIITGRKSEVEWVHFNEIHDLQWDIIIAFYNEADNLLFINSSDNSSLYQELAYALIGDKAELIKGINVFRSFYNIKRVKLQNVGLRQVLGKNIRFRMMVGSDVGEALSLAEKQRGEKAFVMGNGFELGTPVNIGASYKGRVWTKLKGDLKQYTRWCISVGQKLIDETIDPNQILKETLIPKLRTELPTEFPVWIDWDETMYLDTEGKFKFYVNGIRYDLSNIELSLTEPKSGGPLLFSLVAEDRTATFKLELFETTEADGEKYADFKITQQSAEPVEVKFGSKTMNGEEFFADYIPTIWYADGSALTANEYIELKQSMPAYPKDEIIAWDWTGVNLHNESQHVHPKITDSIQYKVIQELKTQNFDIIYDDDYKGEIADVIAMKLEPDKITVKMYHLKYAHGGTVSNQISNFYEVCGQAQKSIHWKHKDGREFINHLLRREEKERSGHKCSRLERGTTAELAKLLSIIKNEIPVEYEIYIVQPALSKANASVPILTLLGVTETFIKEYADISLKVIGSA